MSARALDGAVRVRPYLAPLVFALLLVVPGCAVELEIDAIGSGAPYVAPPRVEFVSPAPGAVYVRDVVGRYGGLVAVVDLEVATSGSLARIDFERAKGEVLGRAGDDRLLFAELAEDGPVTLVARAYGHDGAVVATDTVTLEIAAPEAGGCHEWLALYEVDYTPGPSRDGVAEPVTVTMPINGVSYRYFYGDRPRETFFMDCSLALSLARGAYHLRKRDVIQVEDVGVYNYRCIGGQGTPPDCPRGMSQHAYARALDIAGLTTGDGTYYSVTHDWIIDSGEPTCAARTEPGKDRFLHELICDLKADDVWNIALTPNYNDAHRDHFHVDLTPGADFIKSAGVDQGPDHH